MVSSLLGAKSMGSGLKTLAEHRIIVRIAMRMEVKITGHDNDASAKFCWPLELMKEWWTTTARRHKTSLSKLR